MQVCKKFISYYRLVLVKNKFPQMENQPGIIYKQATKKNFYKKSIVKANRCNFYLNNYFIAKIKLWIIYRSLNGIVCTK